MAAFGTRRASAAATAVIAALTLLALANADPGAAGLPPPRRLLVQDVGRVSPDIPVAPSSGATQRPQGGGQQVQSQQQQEQQQLLQQQAQPLMFQTQLSPSQSGQSPSPSDRHLPAQLPAHVYLISFVLLLSIMLLLLSCHCWRLCRLAHRMETASLAAGHLPTGVGHPYLPAKRSTPDAVIDALPVLRYRDIATGSSNATATPAAGGEGHSSSCCQQQQQQQQQSQSQAVPADEEEPCAVCYEDFEGDDEVKQLPCGHIFHPECIKSWLRIDYTCPVCRTCVWPPFSVGGTDSLGRALALQLSVRDGTATTSGGAAAEDVESTTGGAPSSMVSGINPQRPARAVQQATLDAVLATVGLARQARGGGAGTARRGARSDRPRRGARQRGEMVASSAAAPSAPVTAAQQPSGVAAAPNAGQQLSTVTQ